jgi:hypothetical protein
MKNNIASTNPQGVNTELRFFPRVLKVHDKFRVRVTKELTTAIRSGGFALSPVPERSGWGCGKANEIGEDIVLGE